MFVFLIASSLPASRFGERCFKVTTISLCRKAKVSKVLHYLDDSRCSQVIKGQWIICQRSITEISAQKDDMNGGFVVGKKQRMHHSSHMCLNQLLSAEGACHLWRRRRRTATRLRPGPCAQHSAHVHFTDGVNEKWMTWTGFVQPREYGRSQMIFAPIWRFFILHSFTRPPCVDPAAWSWQACVEMKKTNKKPPKKNGTKTAAGLQVFSM